MAIQQIDLAVPNGDTVRSANIKINQNFSNTTHAASRLVGTDAGNVLEVGTNGLGGGWDRRRNTPNREKPQTLLGTGLSLSLDGGDISSPFPGSAVYSALNLFSLEASSAVAAFHRIVLRSGQIYVQHSATDLESWSEPAEIYTTFNTTIGTNKEIVTSSPVVRVFSDKIEAIHEAKDLPLEFIRNGEGDYTLKGTTGLRNGQNDWQIIIPKDDHDNQLIAFTLDEDTDGTIHLKTYKRTFSMETFTFGPDLNTPLDIPAGRWVDLHFNDLPQTDDPITGV